MECKKICFYSSLLFLINVVVAFYYKYYFYSGAFMLLTITSLCYHSHYTPFTRMVDKIAICLVVFLGGYLFYNKANERTEEITTTQIILSLLIAGTFLFTLLLYYYGYVTSSFCYCADTTTSDYFHAFTHAVCSLGHVCVIML